MKSFQMHLQKAKKTLQSKGEKRKQVRKRMPELKQAAITFISVIIEIEYE